MCDKFTINGNTCEGVLTSREGAELLVNIVELERFCKRDDDAICTRSNIDEVKTDERDFWYCIDQFCGNNGDQLVKSRKILMDDLEEAYSDFNGT